MAGIEGLESNIVAERIAAMNGQENVQPPEVKANPRPLPRRII